MYVDLYAYDADETVEPRTRRISNTKAMERVVKGLSFFVLGRTAIKNFPPENAGDILKAGERDWKVIHSSRLAPEDGGGSLRISTMQLITRERLM